MLVYFHVIALHPYCYYIAEEKPQRIVLFKRLKVSFYYDIFLVDFKWRILNTEGLYNWMLATQQWNRFLYVYRQHITYFIYISNSYKQSYILYWKLHLLNSFMISTLMAVIKYKMCVSYIAIVSVPIGCFLMV